MHRASTHPNAPWRPQAHDARRTALDGGRELCRTGCNLTQVLLRVWVDGAASPRLPTHAHTAWFARASTDGLPHGYGSCVACSVRPCTRTVHARCHQHVHSSPMHVMCVTGAIMHHSRRGDAASTLAPRPPQLSFVRSPRSCLQRGVSNRLCLHLPMCAECVCPSGL